LGAEGITDNSHFTPKGEHIFDVAVPQYLNYGMSWEQYWDGEPSMAKAFRKKAELERKETNWELWLQGLYVYTAIIDVAPMLIPFNKKPKAEPYLKEPIPLSEKDNKELQQAKKKAQFEEQLAKVRAWQKKANEYIRNKEKEVEGNGG